MKNRILKNWSIIRVLYVIIGLSVVYESVSQSRWWGIPLGMYFASMGIFAFGCAAGNCANGSCEIPDKNHS